MIGLRILIAFLAFQIEVRVVADQPKTENTSSFEYVSGALLVKAEKLSDVKFLHGQIKSTHGQYLLLSKATDLETVQIFNKDADLQIQFRSGQRLTLPSGFWVQVQGINQNREQDYSVIKPWAVFDYLKVLRDSRASVDFASEAQELKSIREEAVKVASIIYQKVTDRELASLADQARREQESKDRIEAEKNRRRQLFFQRTFER